MPNSTFCYVVVDAPDKDNYASLSILSSIATRRLHPEANIIWLTCKTAGEYNDYLRREINKQGIEVRRIFKDMHEPFVTSRHIKTQMRQLVNGDFMYLDADTLPIRNVDHLFSTDADVALAWDVDGEPWSERLVRWTRQTTYRKLGWQHHAEGYFNGGVVLFKDTDKAHEVGTLWHLLWLETRIRFGQLLDQPSLNCALNRVAPSINVLPGAYNAIIGTPDEGWHDGARIMHFCCSNYDNLPAEHMVMRKMFDNWKATGKFDEETFEHCVETESPFVES